MDKMAELEKLLQLLKKNRENVPMGDLMTKYRNAYEELLEKIRVTGSEILQEQLNDLQIRERDQNEIVPKITQAIEESEILRESGRVLKNYDLEGFKAQVQRFRSLVMSIWEPYWQQIESEGGGAEQWTTVNLGTTEN